MTEITVGIVFTFFIYMVTVGRRHGLFSPINLLIYLQLIMAVGTAPMLDPNRQSDLMHGIILLSTFLVIIACTTVCTMSTGARRTRPSLDTVSEKSTPPASTYSRIRTWIPGPGTWLTIAIAVIITLAYYSALGYVVLFDSLDSLATGGEEDLTALRLEAYAGERYLYPGYVNQFKNVLLPALTSLVVLYAFDKNKVRASPYVWPLMAVATVGILGTGQRGAFVQFLIVLLVFITFALPARRRQFIAWLLALGLPLFMLSTFASGRARQELAAAADPISQVLVLLGQTLFRITGSNQEASVAAFRYVYERPLQAGADWLASLLGLLPGNSGTNLDNLIFAELYGSSRGNAPPSVWGSAYYNFGFAGPLLIAAILAVSVFALSRVLNRSTARNTMEILGLAGTAATLATWVAGTPTYLFNSGIIVYGALFFVGRKWRLRNAERSGENENKDMVT